MTSNYTLTVTPVLLLLLLLVESRVALGVLEDTINKVQDAVLLKSRRPQPSPRFFLPFVTVTHAECATTSQEYRYGTCYTHHQCKKYGGIMANSCAAGIGTCCVFVRTCGQLAIKNGTYFVNPGAPGANGAVSNCVLEVQLLSTNICQLRLNFEHFSLAQPDRNGDCVSDFMAVLGTSTDHAVPRLCGNNTGQHMYVDVDPTGGNPKINIDTADLPNFSRSWRIKVDQIACDSNYRAPEGCTQYYRESSGTVESFNYAVPTAAQINSNTVNRHLSNLRYSICVASRPGYCSITWRENMDVVPFSFLMNGDASTINPANLVTFGMSTRGNTCTSDYIIIPDGEFNLPAAGVSDRYCGLGFPEQVVSAIEPFVLYVVTNENEAINDVSNAGFSLRYRQNGCQ